MGWGGLLPSGSAPTGQRGARSPAPRAALDPQPVLYSPAPSGPRSSTHEFYGRKFCFICLETWAALRECDLGTQTCGRDGKLHTLTPTYVCASWYVLRNAGFYRLRLLLEMPG